MSLIRHIFTIAILLCVALTADAEPAHIPFSHLDGVSGLSASSVRAVFEDSRGYIWIGTETGLKRYDGSGVSTFGCNVTGLESDFILSIGEDGDGNVWVGTSKGVAVYDYNMDSFFIPKDAEGNTPDVNISYSFANTPSGDICFGTIDGDLWSYGREDHLLHRHRLNLGRYLKSMIADREGNMYLLTYYGYIYRYDILSGKVSPLDIGERTGWFDGDDVAEIAFSPLTDDILYVAAKSKGLCLVDLQSREVRKLTSFGENVRPTDMTVSGGRYLYIATTSGLVRYDILSNSKITIESRNDRDSYALSGGEILSVSSGRSGCLWVGTAHDGLNFHDPQNEQFRRYYRTPEGESLEGCIVSSLAEDASGNIWVATKRKGLLCYVKSSDALVCKNIPGLPDNLFSICIDGRHIWIGTNDGIFRYAPATGALKHYPLLDKLQTKDNRVETVYRTRDGRILAGCVYGGIIGYNREKDCFEYVFDSREITIKSISEDTDGVIWMTSFSQGLFSADTRHPGKFRKWASTSAPGVGEMVFSAFADRNDNVWVLGYNGHIWKFNRSAGALERYEDSASGTFPDASLLSATDDADGTLWIISSIGLVNYNPESRGCRLFTNTDGLLNGPPTGDVLCSSDGTIYSGFTDGLVSFNPSELVVGRDAPRVDLLSMKINGQPVAPSADGSPLSSNINLLDRITLASDQGTFGFKVAVPKTPSAIIRYRLVGFDDNMNSLPISRELNWYGVPPGTYRLEFYTSDLNNALTPCRNALVITVSPPFFKSFYGIILIFFLAIAVITVTTVVFHRKERRQIKQKMAEYKRIRKEQEIKEKMSFFSGIIHEIKTPLTLISSPLKNIESLDCKLPDEVKSDLEVISKGSAYINSLVRELLEYIRTGSNEYKLTRTNVELPAVLRSICASYEPEAGRNGLTIGFSTSDEEIVTFMDVSSLYKIVNNILINALRYAQSEISISLTVEGASVRICISNDGEPIPQNRRDEIFKPFVHYDDEDVSRGFGIGLTFAKSLAELNGGSLVLSPSERTEFVLTLPVTMDEAPASSADEASVPVNKDGRPTIMIVEDNKDILDYQSRKLLSDYNVISCPSAEAALSLLVGTPVDLLLSDIKLGRMNGIELCRKVTSTFETSHIPVIMVSGIATESVKKQCMEAGAVMYIEKPYTIDYLTASISRIFETRAKIISHYLDRSSSADLSEFNSHDSEFLKKLDAIVENHLDDDEFTVSDLSNELFVSQSTLNRKLSALLGMNAGEYIKDKRLKVALDLLKTSGIRINEVCYRVGFSSQSYFTRAFKEKYGKTPSEYIHKG